MDSSFFPRVPLAVPYWNGESYRRVLRCLASGRIVDGPDLAQLREQILKTIGATGALLCGSGSLALEIGLRALELHQGDEVVLPTFCCTAVVPPILAVGATPVLADVGDQLNLTAATVEAALTQKTKAVIVPHLYGNPADIKAIVELAQSRRIRVIDDAAQALGATIDGHPVVGFGDLGILSFGAEKVCFGLGGGALLFPRERQIDKHSYDDLARPALMPAIGNLFSIFASRRLRRWTLPICAAFPERDAMRPDVLPARYRHEAMANLNAALASSLMDSLSANLAARRERVRAYQDLLGDLPEVELVSHQPGSACLAQVIRVAPRQRGEDSASNLITALRAAGYEVRGSYMPIHLLAGFNQCVWDRLPYADRVWADLVELPCEPDVSLDDIERIAGLIRATVRH